MYQLVPGTDLPVTLQDHVLMHQLLDLELVILCCFILYVCIISYYVYHGCNIIEKFHPLRDCGDYIFSQVREVKRILAIFLRTKLIQITSNTYLTISVLKIQIMFRRLDLRKEPLSTLNWEKYMFYRFVSYNYFC